VVGVKVTVVPCGNEALQVPPEQVNPDGLLVTLPLPSPVKETLNERDTVGLDAKVALTEAEKVERATTHEPVPVHAPPQPANVLPLLGVALSMTLEPCGNVPEHVPLKQDTSPVTFPWPAPVKVTLKALGGGGLWGWMMTEYVRELFVGDSLPPRVMVPAGKELAKRSKGVSAVTRSSPVSAKPKVVNHEGFGVTRVS
jgi:hypothetical protein